MTKVIFWTPMVFVYDKNLHQEIWSEIDEIVWPKAWPIPRAGEEVNARDFYGGIHSFCVQRVCWYPCGEEKDDLEPLIYIVLKNRSDQ